MTDPQTTDVADDVAATWKKFEEADDLAKYWAGIAEEHKKQLRATLPPGRYAIAGAPAFSITCPRRFNAEQAKATLTPEQAAMCSVLSAALVEEHLGEEVLDSCRVAGGKPIVRRVSE